MRLILVSCIILSFLTTSCQTFHYEGAAVGAGVGGLTGALIDKNNRWRGGVIGATIGSVAGASIADISKRASVEAATNNGRVEYRSEDNRYRYIAEPLQDNRSQSSYFYPDQKTKCKKVNEKIWENGRLIKDTIKEVCEGDKLEYRY